MLIAIAGSIGAGKSTIARAVSSQLGIPLHSIDDDKLAEGANHPAFQNWVKAGMPFPDSFRQRVFSRTLARLSELAALHPHVIVEETFHRRKLREPFFQAADEILGGLILVEITVDRDAALEHLEARTSSPEDHMAGRNMFEAFESVSDPIQGADLTVSNSGDLDTAVATVVGFLAGRLRLGDPS